MNSESFGELIKKKRIQNGKALREIAADISFDQSLLSKIERNKFLAPQKIILPLAKALDLDYKDLQVKYLSEKLYQELKNIDYSFEAFEIAIRRIELEKSGTSYDLKRQKLIDNIKKYLNNIPVEKAWIFGSFARNEESIDSDIDILIRFPKSHKIDLFEYVGIQQDLEDITGRKIDLVEEGQELENIKPVIQLEKRLIYDRKAV